jgi:short-subunit dehydrogenase
MDLILIARRITNLQDFAHFLENKYGVNVKCIACDLSDKDAPAKIKEVLEGSEINILVYNAALSYIGPFLKNSEENQTQAAQVNILTPLNLVHFYGGKMLERGRGAVVLMSSLAGFQGSGYLSVYAATKAFNRILAESLWYEWKNSGIDIIACIAGATATPGYINTKPEKTGIFTPRVLEPEEVVKECFAKLGKHPSYITGRGNRIASFIMQNIMPRRMAINIMGDTTRKMYRL